MLFVEFEINGQPFQALDGGPQFSFSEAVSFSVEVAGQEEPNSSWNALLAGGEERQWRARVPIPPLPMGSSSMPIPRQ